MIFGVVFGAASPIPGISGGSLAVFANIFEDFFLSANWAVAKKNLRFIAAFILGTACGLYGASRVISFLLGNYGQILYFCFIGLIVGCIPAIYKKARGVHQGARRPRLTRHDIHGAAIFALALSFMLFLAFIGGGSTNSTLEELGGIAPGLLARVFLASFISAIAILIPGVGGSIMMLAFGIYAVYIDAMSTLNPPMLAVLASSMALGIITGIKIIQKMLISHPQKLYSAILGFMLGSLFIIYPGFSIDLTGVLSIVFALGFAFLAYRLSTPSARRT
jgi:putative membrane protein